MASMWLLRNMKNQANMAAQLRGHSMSRWQHITEAEAKSVCIRCGREARVNCRPRLNEISISGETIAVYCATDSAS